MKYVILGASAAGTAAARELRQHDPEGEIVLIAEDAAIHSRCQLHFLASGRRTAAQANFLPPNWSEKYRVDMRLGERVTSLDAAGKAIFVESGERITYDRLIVATGSRTFFPPIPGLPGKKVYGLRDLADAQMIHHELGEVRDVVVIGAGLVGLELAMELAEQGKQVAVVEMASHPLPLQLEEETGARCAELLAAAGLKLNCRRKVTRVQRDADGNPMAVILDSGDALPCDLIVAAAGVLPNVEVLAEAGAAIGRGIIIDDHCRTSLPEVFAAGDCTETRDVIVKRIMPSAIWPSAVRQGQVAAINAAGGDESLARNTGMRASVNLLGTSVISLGAVSMARELGWQKRVLRHTNSRGQHCIRVFFLEGSILRGAVLWGDVTNAGVYGEAIINERNMAEELGTIGDLDGAKRGTELLAVS